MKESKWFLIASIIALIADFICSYGGSESYNDIFCTAGLIFLSASAILSKLEDIEGSSD